MHLDEKFFHFSSIVSHLSRSNEYSLEIEFIIKVGIIVFHCFPKGPSISNVYLK